jgi:hypothetical protein
MAGDGVSSWVRRDGGGASPYARLMRSPAALIIGLQLLSLLGCDPAIVDVSSPADARTVDGDDGDDGDPVAIGLPDDDGAAAVVPDDDGTAPIEPTPPPEDPATPPPNETDVGDDATDLVPAPPEEPVDPVSTPTPPIAVPPALQAVFSFPTAGSDTTLEDTVVGLLDQAAAGSRVRIALYQLTRLRPAQAMTRAFARGVDVRVIFDRNVRDRGANNAWDEVSAGLPADRITVCDRNTNGSCIGTNINHNKLFLFERLQDGSENVVVQSTANLTLSQTRQHNALVIVRNDATLFAGLIAYWNDLKAQRKNPAYDRTVVGDRAVRVYAMPRSTDTVLSVLDNVVCQSGSVIRVNMAFFGDSRLAVAQRFAQLRRAGCQVQMVLRQVDGEGAAPGPDVERVLRDAGVEVTLARTTDDGLRYTTHAKVLIIDSMYQTSSSTRRRQLVFFGSHNYTMNALVENDETLMRLDDAGVFASFVDNWTALRAQHR